MDLVVPNGSGVVDRRLAVVVHRRVVQSWNEEERVGVSPFGGGRRLPEPHNDDTPTGRTREVKMRYSVKPLTLGKRSACTQNM